MSDHTETPTFNQSDKPVRRGSEVLICYAAGDVDVGLVTGIEPNPAGAIVWVAIPGEKPLAYSVDELAPFEEQDMHDEFTPQFIEDDAGGYIGKGWAGEVNHDRSCWETHPGLTHLEWFGQQDEQPSVEATIESDPDDRYGYGQWQDEQAAEGERPARYTASAVENPTTKEVDLVIFDPQGRRVRSVDTTWEADEVLARLNG